MKIKDIIDNKVLYLFNLGDRYYWDLKIVVKIDNTNVVCLNVEGSQSGYVPPFIESVDEEFLSVWLPKMKKNGNETFVGKLKDVLDFDIEYKHFLYEEVKPLRAQYVLEHIDRKTTVQKEYDNSTLFEKRLKGVNSNVTGEKSLYNNYRPTIKKETKDKDE